MKSAPGSRRYRIHEGCGWTIHILKVPDKPVPERKSYQLPARYRPRAGRPIVPYQSEDRTRVTGEIMGFPTLEFHPPSERSETLQAPFR